MKAIVYTRYGSPDVLQLKEIPKPLPEENELLVRIHATTVTTAGLASLSGKPFIARVFSPELGLLRPKQPILGVELAGKVAAVGKNVTRFAVGDRIFAEPESGAFAEYICLPENGLLAVKPDNVTYEQAAASCDGVLTALPFLRDGGRIKQGQHVLINGASASIGTFAVQIAKHFGAEVTGVCSTANLTLVASLGADHVIDYTREDFAEKVDTYDIIFDVVAKSSFRRCRRALTKDGVYLSTFPTPQTLLPSFGRKKSRFIATGLRPPTDRLKDLLVLKELMETGAIRAVIDRRYPLEKVAEACRYVAKGHKKGNVIITVRKEET